MTDVRQKLATGEPLDFLAYVSTLVAALAVLGPDELGRARARQAFKASPHEVPGWLARLTRRRLTGRWRAPTCSATGTT